MAARGGSAETGPGSGCSIHGTPQGVVCAGCQRQGQLFTRAAVARQARKRRGQSRGG